MQSSEIRTRFLDFFKKRGHTVVPSSSLVPAGDATLLFTNAGMVPFKDAFLGIKTLSYSRAASSQKCVRAGGKHNDLENVGFTPRHHTFFEMLGNFSFGDYFKKEAIDFAWTLLTEGFRLPIEKLHITVHEKDNEAFDLWVQQGVAAERITRLGDKDNFWAMGDTGPCGPCSEIYYDWGETYCSVDPKNCKPGCPCDTRFLEIWNLVFMQYNREASGTLHPLPKPSVDTGAGLERLCSVLQGTFSNYETDLFRPILKSIEAITHQDYVKEASNSVSFRVIADHIRSCCFLISDGVFPSNEGRGYVLRRILRRAIRHGKNLGQEQPFLFKLAAQVASVYKEAYPSLSAKLFEIESTIQEEEKKFHETLHKGLSILEHEIQKSKSQNKNLLDGELCFKLYDTFGFPLDLIELIAGEQGLKIDRASFDKKMEHQKSQSQWSQSSFKTTSDALLRYFSEGLPQSEFLGYQTLTIESKVEYVFDLQGNPTDKLASEGLVILSKTPFYAESGGQSADVGHLKFNGSVFEVFDVQKLSSVPLHFVRPIKDAKLKQGDRVQACVDSKTRKKTAVNHTATHLLHAALRKTLGDRVKQAGSLVNSEKLRFDFTSSKAVTLEELEQVETLVNEQIYSSSEVTLEELDYQTALNRGALAFFDEKYEEKVRVIQVGPRSEPFSIELCGGTHLTNTSEIGLFKIVSESSVASGVRRIEAITGKVAFNYLNQHYHWIKTLEKVVHAKDAQIVDKIVASLDDHKKMSKEVETLKLKLLSKGNSVEASKSADTHELVQKNVKVIVRIVPDTSPKLLRQLIDQAKDNLKSRGIVLIGSVFEGKASYCLGVTPDLIAENYNASKLMGQLNQFTEGTGGGKSDFAQGGSTKPQHLKQNFDAFLNWLKEN